MVQFKVEKVPAVIAIFDEAQSNVVAVSQLIAKLSRVLNEMDRNKFTAGFITCLKVVFKATVEFNNSVDRVIEFAVDFLVSTAKLNTTKDELPSEEAMNLLYEIFNFLNDTHGISDMIVRKRTCQFVVKFFSRLRTNADLDCEICNIVVTMMKDRIKDKVPIIRMQAVLAIFRLQDRSDPQCPVTKMLINSIETDSSAEVRRLALSKLSLSHKADVKKIIYRIDDVSEKVRMEAYKVLSKLHLKQFTIEFRKKLLSTGLYDNNVTVKNTVKKILLPAWLKRIEGNILQMLEALDLNVDGMEWMTKAIMAIFEDQSSDYVRETLDELMDQLHVISYDKLTCESAFLWRCYVFYSSKIVSEKNDYRWDSNSSYDAAEVGLLPDLSVFCEYIKTYFNFSINKEDAGKPWQKREQEFILIQLIELCKVYDYSDEVGRKELNLLCLDLLRHVEMKTIRHVVELYFMLQTNLNDSISKIAELINDLLNPPLRDIAANGDNVEESSSKNGVERCSDLITDPNIKFKLAQLEVQFEELKEAQEEAIILEEFVKAEEMKNEIANVREKIAKLKHSFFEKAISVNNDGVTVDKDLLQSLDEDELANPLQNVEISTVERSVTILRETLHLTSVKSLTPELRTLVQVLVLPALRSDNSVVAPIATEVLGSFCLRDKSLAKEYFTMFFALCGNSDICVSALKVIFDFLLCFGPTAFNINNFDDYEKNKLENKNNSDDFDEESDENDFSKDLDDAKDSENMISGYTFISILVDLLDDESVEVRLVVVHGLCQLMATGKLKSSKVLMRLILMWFHPSSKISVEIRDCLNFFFPFFAKQCVWALPLFENAFIPTMMTLFNAPFHNPLSEVDQKCVVKVLCDIVSPTFVESTASYNIHCNLAVLFCNTIIDLSDPNHQVVLLKGLNYLDLSVIDSSMLTSLLNLLQKIIKKFKRKSYKKLIADAEKIKTKLLTLQKNIPENPSVCSRGSSTASK